MSKKILKKVFSSRFMFSRKGILIISFIVAGGLFMPFFYANAGVATALVTLVLQTVLLLARGLLELTGNLLKWAASNPFNISYTNPGGANPNPIIEIGWTLIRDFTNMLFILGLAYIGLSTALNLSNFNTKKVFPKLIGVALIINFTPVICGVIVDISNIISNFFLVGLEFGILSQKMRVFEGQTFLEIPKLLGSPEVLVKTIFLIFYGFTSSLMLLMFTALFFIRHIAIWILVVLSPAAFFALIFDKSKPLFTKWWSQLWQWSTIAIPVSFFLYLSQKILVNIEDYTLSGEINDYITELAPYFVVTLFLIFGFMLSLQINAMGSGAIVKATQKIKGEGLKQLKIGGKKLALGTGKGTAGGIAGGIKGLKEGTGIKGRALGFAKGAFTKQGREKGREATGKLLERAHLARPGHYEEMKRKKLAGDIDEEKKRLRRLSPTRQSEILDRISKSKITTSKEKTSAAALIEMLAEKGQLEDKHKGAVKKYKGYGIDMSTVLKNKPGWIADFEKDMDRLDFDMLKGMKASDIDYIITQGSQTTQQAVKQAFINNNINLADHVLNLRKDGKTNQARVVEDMLKQVANKLS